MPNGDGAIVRVVDFKEAASAHSLVALVAEIIQLIRVSYRKADTILSETGYRTSVAKDTRVHLVRAEIENGLEMLARRVPGVVWTEVFNSKNGSTHGELHVSLSSYTIVLTESALSDRYGPVDSAEYRKNLAAAVQLPMDLGPGLTQPTAPPGALYAVIQHGYWKGNPAEPAYIDMVFYGNDCSTVLYRKNLFLQRAAVEPDEVVVPDMEQEVVAPPQVQPKRRRERTDDREESA